MSFFDGTTTINGRLKACATTVKADLELLSGLRVFGYARWRKDCVKLSSKLA